MVYTIDVDPRVNELFLQFVKSLDTDVKILAEDDDTIFTKEELVLREEAMKDYRAGNTVSFEEFKKEFFDDL